MPVADSIQQVFGPEAPSVSDISVYRQSDNLPTPFESLLDSVYIEKLINTQLAEPADTVIIKDEPPAWTFGKQPQARSESVGKDSGLMTIIICLFVLFALNYKYCPRFFANSFNELFSIRRRANVFDEHTNNESRVLGLLIMQYIAAGGILLYGATRISVPSVSANVFLSVVLLMGLMAAYYIFQNLAYSLVGYLFTDAERRRQWLRSFNASQALIGPLLLIPALISLFYPSTLQISLIFAIGLYFVARLIFIVKGFRIFFTKISSLLYFILYLCTLEILPVLIVMQSAVILTQFK